jgi:hypothetical protein
VNRNFLICALLTISVQTFGQTVSKVNNPALVKTIEIDPFYFTLGTLWDYSGRFTYVDKSSQVDRYYVNEKPLMDYLERMIKKELNIEIKAVPDNESNVRRYETYSPELSSSINSFFNNNHLIIDSLKNLPKLNYSYLAGRYYRYGHRINDSIYSIQIANSADHKAIDSLLRRIGCNKIHFKYLNNIPAQFIYYFIPTNELETYFDSLANEKKKLEDSYLNYLQSELKIDIGKLTGQIPKKECMEIINLFKK